MLPARVFVANGGDATVAVLDAKATSVQSTLSVGGRRVGVVRTVDGRLFPVLLTATTQGEIPCSAQ